jgi:hypothetical protein
MTETFPDTAWGSLHLSAFLPTRERRCGVPKVVKLGCRR